MWYVTRNMTEVRSVINNNLQVHNILKWDVSYYWSGRHQITITHSYSDDVCVVCACVGVRVCT